MNNIADARFAEEANMQNKNKLQKLTLEWSDCPDLIKEPVSELEQLKPHRNLEELIIKGFCGNRFPSWLADGYLLKLATLEIKNCINTENLPCLGRLPSLKYLCVQSMATLKRIGSEFCGHASSSSSNPNIVGFMKLETLVFKRMDSWEEWSGVERGDFPYLKSLILNGCEKLHIVSQFPRSVHLKAIRCPFLKDSENETGLRNKQINHCYPLLVLSDCGSRFKETADPLQEMETSSSQVIIFNDANMEESRSKVEETTVQLQVQSSNNTPCSYSDDSNMAECASKVEETTIQKIETPDSQVHTSANVAVMVECGSILDANTVQFQEIQTSNGQVEANARNTMCSYCDDMMVEANAVK